MSEQELRARLERALHTRVTAAEWRRLKKTDLVGECQRGALSWEEFRDFARRDLDQIRDFAEDLRREQAGELLEEVEINEDAPESGGVTEISAPLSERTAARAAALNALDRRRLGPTAWGIVTREIRSRIRPHGGADEALPQWVIELGIEAWVPAEDVRSIYRQVQCDLLAEGDCTKTPPRTFRVAQFVWEQELRFGKRPSWRVLLERWKERNPDDEGFKDWRAFRTCFKRGEKATPPRYLHSNDYIASEGREFPYWEARRLRERLRYLPE